MNIKCMLLLACFTAIAVPTESLPMPRHHRQSLTRPRNQPMKSIAVAPPTPPRLKLPRPLPLLRPLPRARIPISRRSTPALSAKTTAHTPSNRVEQFAKKLRDDMDKQERVLNAFITTIKQKHQQSKLKLSRVNIILKRLKDQIANATQYANKYQAEVNTQTGQDKIILDDYEKSHKMFSEERANIEFEKKFLEEIIKYIQMRRTNCLTK